MPTNFPNSLDNFVNPNPTDRVNNPSHASQHANANDAIRALEEKVGVDNSTVQTSHDYKLGEITGSDRAVGKNANQTISNKTLVSPKIDTAILDTNGNEVIKLPANPSAVNEITVNNAPTTQAPSVQSSGDDDNIDLVLKGKGSGYVKIGNSELKFPNSDGLANQVLKTDGSGNLSWVDQSLSPRVLTLTPFSTVPTASSLINISLPDSNTAYVGQVSVPYQIDINKISFLVVAFNSSGQIKIAIYKEDGQTKLLEVTSPTITSSGLKTINLGSTFTLSPGIYYIALAIVGTPSFNISMWNTTITSFSNDVSGGPVLEGTISITDGNLPSSFDPTSINYTIRRTLVIRLDN